MQYDLIIYMCIIPKYESCHFLTIQLRIILIFFFMHSKTYQIEHLLFL